MSSQKLPFLWSLKSHCCTPVSLCYLGVILVEEILWVHLGSFVVSEAVWVDWWDAGLLNRDLRVILVRWLLLGSLSSNSLHRSESQRWGHLLLYRHLDANVVDVRYVSAEPLLDEWHARSLRWIALVYRFPKLVALTSALQTLSRLLLPLLTGLLLYRLFVCPIDYRWWIFIVYCLHGVFPTK